ncbi:MAG: potassium transporter KtrA [Flavobacteriales bacterium]|nr:potassium transporter KtrA [Flavobacteriales bacterium]|tara:strand:+ start:216 stop:896 length:681 start_codon:yes stop_codon:yes gene_type:complete
MKNKFAVIGLGQFGTAIAKTLSSRNAEVIAIDKDLNKVEDIKDFVAYTVAIDATNMDALKSQNIQDMDCVIVAIGENFHSAILCINILIELGVKRIIGRSMGENERLILEKLGIKEIISPEDELGFRITESILNPNILFSMPLPDNYLIVELKAPKKICDEKLGEIKLREDFGLNLITILRATKINENLKHHISGIPSANTVINSSDILVLFGKSSDITKFVDINN